MVKQSVTRRAKRKGSEEDAPTGPHTPISNIITEGERVRTSWIYQPESGSAQGMVDLSKLEKQATRELGARVAAASIQVPRAAKDVGRASFRDPEVVLETVHGKDDRVQVQDTDKFPHCAVASLLITARDGSQ
jgi:glutamyl endopeptidase